MISRVRVIPRQVIRVQRIAPANEWERSGRRHFLTRDQFEAGRRQTAPRHWIARLLGRR